jgi:hypothetical protein
MRVLTGHLEGNIERLRHHRHDVIHQTSDRTGDVLKLTRLGDAHWATEDEDEEKMT